MGNILCRDLFSLVCLTHFKHSQSESGITKVTGLNHLQRENLAFLICVVQGTEVQTLRGEGSNTKESVLPTIQPPVKKSLL